MSSVTEASVAVLNPAYFRWSQKPAILWNDQDRAEAAAEGFSPEAGAEFSYGMGWK